MTLDKPLNNVWLKAAVIGCLWAASEIILGSFLHNFKIPLRSNILTSVGIILLISIAHIWKDKGIFWRAGLICALMKSISPSAIIFGPMIAILSQSILIEIILRVFKRNLLTYILSGVLAMSWNFFQFVGNYIIIYGSNIIDLYKNLTTYTQKFFNIKTTNVWEPLFFLLAIYIFMGFISAVLGIYVGKKTLKEPLKSRSLTVEEVKQIKSMKAEMATRYSLYALFFNFLGLVCILFLMAYTRWFIWLVFGTLLILIWAYRYKQSLKPLAKPKFWLFFIVISVLSAYLLSALSNNESHALNGLLIGLEMNFRAALTIIGFSTIGTELRNPSLKKIFPNSRFKQASIAFEVAFDTLPMVIANLPLLKDVFKKPIKIFHEVVSQIDYWLDKIELRAINRSNIIFITGHEKTGKSSFLYKIVKQLKQEGIHVGGFISPAVREDDIFTGHDLLSLKDGKQYPLSRINGTKEMPRVGNYYFKASTINKGHELLNINNLSNTDVVVVDEIGPWELKNNGWATALSPLLKLYDKPMIWVVRESIIDKVVLNWAICKPLIINVKEVDEDEIQKKILNIISNSKTK